ncbi:MAG TPA: mechanosensitive ion channel domain-containing protein, partial [Azospirillaceae bacterium]|nr:mechanosensitive ion channel domain-containing protein [Azospirillaceae bacterium]
ERALEFLSDRVAALGTGKGLALTLVRGVAGTVLAMVVARLAVMVAGLVLAGRFQRLLRPLTVAAWAAAGAMALTAWGVDVPGWLETPVGRRVGGSALTIAVVVLLAVVTRQLTDILIERGLGAAVLPNQRLRTLVPLLRSAFLVALVVLVALTVLAELGVNIAPLLAGAGVAGLAIGFGAQTLVKDVITGLFILFEDSVAVGEVVDVGGGHAGVAEEISIRSIRLRDEQGAVHTVPFSAVTSVVNRSRKG